MSKPIFNKPKLYKDQPLKGEWQVTTKIDGVRAFINTSSYNVTSRAGKPFFNFSKELIDRLVSDKEVIDCEVFRNSWEETITLVKKEGSSQVTEEDLYVLTDEGFDRRLQRDWLCDPSKEEVEARLKEARDEGHEGLVLRQGDVWYKVKPYETYDVKVIGVTEAKKEPLNCEYCGNEKGKVTCIKCNRPFSKMDKIFIESMGALVTPMGKVGTGFNDYERDSIWESREEVIGMTIEVKCMELTRNGKFRHPVFVRFREDK